MQRVVHLLQEWMIDMDVMWPCLEQEGPDAFLVGPISKWKHQSVPLMLGTTSGEGLLRTGCECITNDLFNQNR